MPNDHPESNAPRRATAAAETLLRALEPLPIGLSAFFLFQALALAVFTVSVTGGKAWPPGCLAAILKPLILFGVTGIAVLFRGAPGPREGAARPALVLAVCALAMAAQSVRPQGRVEVMAQAVSMIPFLIVPFLLARRAGEAARPWKRKPSVFVLSLLCGELVALCSSRNAHPSVNRLGLVSARPSSMEVKDFSRHTNKDHYPPCRFLYNSLGYRDIEPSFDAPDGRKRILLVGNSYTWGDGIPTNEETLGYRLRDELERRAPGRFSVMVAAYPALGLYGYSRIVKTIAPLYRPDIVLIQYAPFRNHMLSDPQFLLDRLPANRFLRDAVLFMDGIWHLCNSLVVVSSKAPSSQPHSREEDVMGFGDLLPDLAASSAREGYRLVFLMYDTFGSPREPGLPFPDPIERLYLPKSWDYTGVSSDLWYAKDAHPKPKLSAMVGAYVAAMLESARPPRSRSRRAPRAHPSAPASPPGSRRRA